MPVTVYGYRDAMSAFFEFPTENAREILPDHLEPVEVHHGTSIFAMTAFDFNESSVGEYGEIVMAVIVSPLVKPGERLPKSAMYPYLVATTTKAARDHARVVGFVGHWAQGLTAARVHFQMRIAAQFIDLRQRGAFVLGQAQHRAAIVAHAPAL